MKYFPSYIIILLMVFFSCKKDYSICGVTNINGPVRYYLAPNNESLFYSYKSFHSLAFIDSATALTSEISYSSDHQISHCVIGQAKHQGDTVDQGETAGINYNVCSANIGGLQYYFNAYKNGSDSLEIFIISGDPPHPIPAYVFFWTLSLTDLHRSGNGGYTPFIVMDSITLLSRTFHDVYVLQNGIIFLQQIHQMSVTLLKQME